MTQSELLADQVEGTREWTLKLLDGLSHDDWRFQPEPGLPHALWLCGHLAVAQHLLIHVRCLGGGCVDDSFASHFPIGMPVLSTVEHDYPSVDTVLDIMTETHRKTCEAIRGMSDDLLNQPCMGAEGKPHPHYTDKRGVVSHCSRHEAFHAGQLALLRRLLGKPFLR